MCSACISNLAVALIGLTSTGGLTAMVMTRRGTKRAPIQTEPQKDNHASDEGGTHAQNTTGNTTH